MNFEKEGILSVTIVLGLALAAAAPAAATYPTARQAEIGRTSKYVGGAACQNCHSEIHGEWKTSWHTLKATRGPALGKEFEKNIYDWVRRDWDELDTYLILDRKDKDTVFVSTRKYGWQEVEYVIGQIHKQRYMIYSDGRPATAWEARTKDGGISWTIDKTATVQFAGNKERAGYHFLFIETKPKAGEFNKNNYGEYRSWQERCIGCHTTGFDYKAWEAAKADFVAGKRKDLRDLFVADLRVSCEMCHGPGFAHVKEPGPETIINPARITDVAARQMVCGQCHTRPDRSIHGKTAQDLRGYRLGDKYEDFASFTRPNWGKGNRQVSIDGKGRRDHQQDMDIRLSATTKGSHSVHAAMACFDCHEVHALGNDKENPRLKKPERELCAACHLGQADAVLKALDGRKGWDKADYPNWGTEYGRQPNKQHIFNLDVQGRSYGITPAQYHWALKKGGDPKKDADWQAIWPWEKAFFEAKGEKVSTGAAPWDQ